MGVGKNMEEIARKRAFQRPRLSEAPDTDKKPYPINISYDPTDPRSVAGYKALQEIGYV